MRIASRILAGFSLVILLVAVMGVLFWFGAVRGVESLERLNSQSERLATVNALNQQVLQLQRNIRRQHILVGTSSRSHSGHSHSRAPFFHS